MEANLSQTHRVGVVIVDRCTRGSNQWRKIGGEGSRDQLHSGLSLERSVLLAWGSNKG